MFGTNLKVEEFEQLFKSAEKMKVTFGITYKQALLVALGLVGVDIFSFIAFIEDCKNEINVEKISFTSDDSTDMGRPTTDFDN